MKSRTPAAGAVQPEAARRAIPAGLTGIRYFENLHVRLPGMPDPEHLDLRCLPGISCGLAAMAHPVEARIGLGGVFGPEEPDIGPGGVGQVNAAQRVGQ